MQTPRPPSWFASEVFRIGGIGSVFLCFLIGYIVQVNMSSTRAYALRDATLHHEEIARANDRLLAEIDRLRSLESIKERAVFLDLVPQEQVVYLNQ